MPTLNWFLYPLPSTTKL